MTLFVLGLGSARKEKEPNGAMESRTEKLRWACQRLSSEFQDFNCSAFYETPAVGHKASGTYLNAVAEATTETNMEQTEALLKRLEIEAGRDAEARARGEVPLDIDIVIWDGEIVRHRDYSQSFFQIGYRSLHHSESPLTGF